MSRHFLLLGERGRGGVEVGLCTFEIWWGQEAFLLPTHTVATASSVEGPTYLYCLQLYPLHHTLDAALLLCVDSSCGS
jgi:hypothetical protein